MAINNNQNTPNIAELAKSPYGDIEITKYLYESGLQNIFNTYQQNVASLSQSKQTELQDAYTVREMSKKYLGEYASNVGLGDVSGNLLDIYGQYQSNLSDIERNYGQLEMGLQQQFQQQRQEGLNNLLMAEFGLESAKLNERERNVMYNIEMGQTNDLTDQEYLDREYQAGNISQEMYQNASMGIMNNQRTTEERQIWGQAARGELSKDELTEAYQEGRLSEEAYTQFFNAMDAQERQDAAGSIELDLVRGNTGGLTNEEYLDQKLQEGVIDQNTYNNLTLQYVASEEIQAQERETERQRSEVSFNVMTGQIPEGTTLEEYLNDAFDKGLIDGNTLTTLLIRGFDEQRMRDINDIYTTARGESNYEDFIMDQVASGRIDEMEAQDLLSELQREALAEFEARFRDPQNMYGFDEEGQLILSQQGLLDHMRGKIGEEAYQRYSDLIREGGMRSVEFGFETGPQQFDLSGLTDDPGITSESELFYIAAADGSRQQYAVSAFSVVNDPFFEEADVATMPSFDTLRQFAEVDSLQNNTPYRFADGNFYLYKDNNLFRLAPVNTEMNREIVIGGVNIPEIKLFTSDIGKSDRTAFFDTEDGVLIFEAEFRTGKNQVTFTINNTPYTFQRGDRVEDTNIINAFEAEHGPGDNKGGAQILSINGQIYYRERKKIYVMEPSQ